MFDESPHLPDTLLTPLGNSSQSDEKNLKQKRDLYQWSTEGGFPPYLKQIPRDEQVGIFKIFDVDRVWAVTRHGWSSWGNLRLLLGLVRW